MVVSTDKIEQQVRLDLTKQPDKSLSLCFQISIGHFHRVQSIHN
jgi:hypothetical protein